MVRLNQPLHRSVRRLVCALTCALIVTLPHAALAATLVSYTFTGDSLSPSNVHAGVGASQFGVGIAGGVGVSFFPTYNTNYYGPSGSPSLASSSWDSADFEAADNNGQFYTFTVTLSTPFDLTALDLYLNSNTLGPQTYDVRYSLDGFAATLDTGLSPIQPTMPTMLHLSIPLSDTNVTGPVAFRVYAYDPVDTAGSFRIDDVTLTGTLLPEPGTAGAILTGLVLAVFRRDRHA